VQEFFPPLKVHHKKKKSTTGSLKNKKTQQENPEDECSSSSVGIGGYISGTEHFFGLVSKDKF
jgi:hypothetical protein